MFGINTLLNTPLAINKDYLLSVIPSLLMEYSLLKSQNFTRHWMEEVYMENINAQSSGKSGIKSPVVVDIRGPIVKYTSWNGVGTQFYGQLLKYLDRDPSISGIVLNIDSGGGMVSGTAELTSIIKGLSKPTISYTAGYQCSAAQDIASGCQYHMASPHADLLGSIGVMLSYQDFSAMFEKWGAHIYELYAPQSTEKNKEWRDLMSGDEVAYTERLKVLANNFISRMKENFGEKLKDDGLVFKGKTYTPQEAKAIGLVDEIGSLEDALNKF